MVPQMINEIIARLKKSPESELCLKKAYKLVCRLLDHRYWKGLKPVLKRKGERTEEKMGENLLYKGCLMLFMTEKKKKKS